MRSSALVLAGVLVLGCGSSGPVLRTTSPFTAELHHLYDDGVDFVADPELLEGSWREQWSSEIGARIDAADYVAIVRITSITNNEDLDHRMTYRLVATSSTLYWGDAPIEDLTLPVREGAPGYVSIDQNTQRVMASDFVLYVKWDQPEEGEAGAIAGPGGNVIARWHLSPASDEIKQRVQFLTQRRRQAGQETQQIVRERRN